MNPHRGQWIAAVALWVAAGAAAQTPEAPAGAASAPLAASAPSAAADPGARRLPPPSADPREGRPLSSQGSSGPSFTRDFVQTIVALAVVLAIILGLRLLLRRYWLGRGRTVAPGVIEVLARTGLAARHQVVLVRVGQRIWLVGCGPDGLRSLGQINDPAEVSAILGAAQQSRPNSLSRGFARALTSWREQVDLDEDAEPSPEGPQTPAGGAAAQMQSVLQRVRDLGGQGDQPR